MHLYIQYILYSLHQSFYSPDWPWIINIAGMNWNFQCLYTCWILGLEMYITMPSSCMLPNLYAHNYLQYCAIIFYCLIYYNSKFYSVFFPLFYWLTWFSYTVIDLIWHFHQTNFLSNQLSFVDPVWFLVSILFIYSVIFFFPLLTFCFICFVLYILGIWNVWFAIFSFQLGHLLLDTFFLEWHLLCSANFAIFVSIFTCTKLCFSFPFMSSSYWLFCSMLSYFRILCAFYY